MSKIKKNDLIDFIKKYNLGGISESVVMTVKENKLSTVYILDDNSLHAEIVKKHFDYEDVELAIQETSPALKMLSILDDEVEFKLNKVGDKCKSLELSDSSVCLKISLQDKDLIPSAAVVDPPKTQFVSLNIVQDDLIKMSKAISSLTKCEKFSISCDSLTSILTFTFKENSSINSTESNTMDDNSVSFKFELNGENIEEISRLDFISESFKNIIDVNKEYDSCEVIIYSKGLIKIEYDNDNINSKYHLVAIQVGDN